MQMPCHRVVIEFSETRDPIQGTVAEMGGRTTAFAGWVELIRILERCTERDADTRPREEPT